MPGWGRAFSGPLGSHSSPSACPEEGTVTSAAATSPGWGSGVCRGCPGLTWKRVAILSGEASPLVWLGGDTGDLGTKGGQRGLGSAPAAQNPRVTPGSCREAAAAPQTGTSRPGKGCQLCLASLAPDSLIREPGQAPAGVAPPQEPPRGGKQGVGDPSPHADPRVRCPGCPQLPPLHLQPELPRALLDLVLRLHVEHLGRAVAVDGDNDIPRPEVTRGRLPVLRHLHGEKGGVGWAR